MVEQRLRALGIAGTQQCGDCLVDAVDIAQFGGLDRDLRGLRIAVRLVAVVHGQRFKQLPPQRQRPCRRLGKQCPAILDGFIAPFVLELVDPYFRGVLQGFQMLLAGVKVAVRTLEVASAFRIGELLDEFAAGYRQRGVLRVLRNSLVEFGQCLRIRRRGCAVDGFARLLGTRIRECRRHQQAHAGDRAGSDALPHRHDSIPLLALHSAPRPIADPSPRPPGPAQQH